MESKKTLLSHGTAKCGTRMDLVMEARNSVIWLCSPLGSSLLELKTFGLNCNCAFGAKSFAWDDGSSSREPVESRSSLIIGWSKVLGKEWKWLSASRWSGKV